MPFNDVGFYVKRRGLGAQGGVSPTPGRGLVITPSLSNNAETITWSISSNMTSSPTLRYEITNVSNTDFSEGTITGNITLNGSGAGSLSRNLEKFINYSNSNVVFNLRIYSDEEVFLGESSNAVIKPATPFTALGGNITTIDNGNITLHQFKNTTTEAFQITNLGDYPNNATVRVLTVAGGGPGGDSFTYYQKIFDAFNIISYTTGAGGGAGGATESNILANAFTVGNVTVTVGAGGAYGPGDDPTNGGNTIFGNIIMIGGGSGDGPYNSDARSGGSGGGGSADNNLNSPGDGTSGQGSRGGYPAKRVLTTNGIRILAGGGGGYSQVGGNASYPAVPPIDIRPGNGGDGLYTDITGTGTWFAGGGAGGADVYTNPAGLGGGGGGGSRDNPTPADGTPNTGGGGGGAGAAYFTAPNQTNYKVDGSNGGSGIVVVRYRTRYRNLALQ